MSSELQERLLALPKADLHVHFEGTATVETLQRLSEKNSVSLDKPVQIGEDVLIPPPLFLSERHTPKDFKEFISLYAKIAECIRSKDDVTDIARAYFETAHSENITHAEIYFSPTTFYSLGRDMSDLFSGLNAAQEIAHREYQLSVGWIFDIVRNATVPHNLTLDLALEAQKQGAQVVAIGLAGYEAVGPAKNFTGAIREARDHGFTILAHAGETAGAESVYDTITLLKPTRIGHGIRALENPEVVALLKEQQTPIEVCPWSNVYLLDIPPEEHPIEKMHDAGLNITIGSDDPGIFRKSLTDNYLLAHQLGIPERDLERMTEKSFTLQIKSP